MYRAYLFLSLLEPLSLLLDDRLLLDDLEPLLSLELDRVRLTDEELDLDLLPDDFTLPELLALFDRLYVAPAEPDPCLLLKFFE